MRSMDPSFLERWTEERRLCTIIESEHSSNEQKYDALIELAFLSGILTSGALASAA